MTALELEKLLSWYLVPKKEMGNKHQKITKWKEIVNNSIVPPMFDPWVGDDVANLAKLKEKEIDLTDTAFVRQVVVERQKAKAVIDHLTADELEDMKRRVIAAKLAKQNVEDELNNMHV